MSNQKKKQGVVNEIEGIPCKYCVPKTKKQNYFKEENVFTSLIDFERSRKMRTENKCMKTLSIFTEHAD